MPAIQSTEAYADARDARYIHLAVKKGKGEMTQAQELQGEMEPLVPQDRQH
ncbi:MAG: hypothetical protein ACJ74Y_12250 [Bryobacteraceae bacterium]